MSRRKQRDGRFKAQVALEAIKSLIEKYIL